jgi:glucose/arabinose dehydrogenase
MRPIAVLAALLTFAIAGTAAACGDGDTGGGASTGESPAQTSAAPEGSPSSGSTSPARSAASRPRTIARDLDVPWGIAPLPGGDALVAERDSGRIVRVPRGRGQAREVMTIPGVRASGESGLLGIAVSPGFASDQTVFAYFTSGSDNRIVSFRLGDDEVRPLLTGIEAASIHDGGRIAFGPDGKLYAGTGDAGDSDLAQDRGSPNGKILRINPDGSIPSDNPFPGSPVWSLGHRNVQGLAWDRAGRLWATEFGQSEFDEVNLIRKGRNYGWPVVEGRGGTDGGRFTNPKVTWTPTGSSSPSGAAIVGSNLYVGALAGETLWRIPLRGTSAGRPRAMFRGRYGRIRTVVAAPDRRVWFSTSNRDGRGSPAGEDDRIFSFRP